MQLQASAVAGERRSASAGATTALSQLRQQLDIVSKVSGCGRGKGGGGGGAGKKGGRKRVGLFTGMDM